MKPSSSRLVALLTCGILLALVGPAAAADYWAQKRGDCDKVAFKEPEGTPLQAIASCVKLWEAYKDVATATGSQRDRVVAATLRLYTQGDDSQAHLAKYALGRLRVERLPQRTPSRVGTGGGGGAAKAAEPARAKCDVPPPDKGALKAANKHLKKGLKSYKKKKYGAALESFLAAVEAAPGWPRGRYNAAAMHAIQGEADDAMEQLYCLQDIGDDDAIGYLKKSRTDGDFEPIRDDSEKFKELTGYARIKIGNSLGEYGEDNVDNLEATLGKLGYAVDEVTETKKPYKAPLIWYKPASRTTAYFVMLVMDHPKTKLSIVDWEDEDFDVIIAWGDDVQKGKEPKVYVKDPADAEKEIDGMLAKQDEALRKPDKMAREVDKAVDTPNRIADQGQDAADRVDKTVDTMEKTGENIKKAGDAIKGLGGF